MAGKWVAEFYVDGHGRSPMANWLDDLSDVKYAAMSAAIKHKLEVYGIELAGSAWLTPLGEGLYELRVRHSEDEIVGMHKAAGRASTSKATSEKILLRAFVTFHGERICLLFGGYDKGADTSEKRQQKEIAKARKLKKEWGTKVARDKAAQRKKGRRG